MKKIIALTILFLSAATAGAVAQPAPDAITVTGVTVERRGDSVRIGYTATIARRAVGRGRTLVFAPVVTGDGFRRQVPAVVVVHGRGSKVARRRREWILGAVSGYEYATTSGNGQSVAVSTSVPFDERMQGGRVTLESVYGGCCNHEKGDDILLADNILPPPPTPAPVPAPVQVVATTPAPVPPPPVVTVPDPPKVLPADPPAPPAPVEPSAIRDEEFKVYFRVSRYDIDPGYMDNERTLLDLVRSVREILASGDRRLVNIVVGGFASPEGGSEINNRLGFKRAVAMKKYIAMRTGLGYDRIETYNGEVDWEGLRQRIEESTMPEKRQLLDIIDTMPIWDSRRQVGRLGTIMRLNGGDTYRRLLREHFPYLRSGAFIQVYYENYAN
jgi:outer membrane protein OmpA-like peptidoglycan-associated protein